MNISPLVSVVIPVLNGACFIKKAIESVQKQSFKDLEVIVVDDGSTDDTQRVVKELNPPVKIRMLHQDHAGPARGRNRGIHLAQGQFVALLDCDDLWLPNKLELQLDLMERKPDVGLVHSDFEVVDLEGNVLDRVKARSAKDPLAQAFQGGHVALLSTLLIRKSVLDRIHGFDPYLYYGSEDSDFVIRLLEVTEFQCIDRVLVRKLDLRPSGRQLMSDRNLDGEKVFASKKRFLEKLEGKTNLTKTQRAILKREWANYFLDLGKTTEGYGKGLEARRCYLQAIQKAPFRFRSYSRYIRTLF